MLRELEGRERHAPRDDIVRLAVRLRARDACEYCLLPTTSQFHVEYVIPPVRWDAYAQGKLPAVPPLPGRQGPEHVDNFAWCCPFCNLTKSQRVEQTVGQASHRLFDPRRDRWSEHMRLAPGSLFIVGVTGIGRATELGARLQRRPAGRPARGAAGDGPGRALPAPLGARLDDAAAGRGVGVAPGRTRAWRRRAGHGPEEATEAGGGEAYQSITEPSSAYALAVLPVVADLVGQRLLVELDAQAGPGRAAAGSRSRAGTAP